MKIVFQEITALWQKDNQTDARRQRKNNIFFRLAPWAILSENQLCLKITNSYLYDLINE